MLGGALLLVVALAAVLAVVSDDGSSDDRAGPASTSTTAPPAEPPDDEEARWEAQERAMDRCYEALAEGDGDGTARSDHLADLALRSCLAGEGADLDELGFEAPEPCYAAYRALDPAAPEAAWTAADLDVQACFLAAPPEIHQAPRLVGGVVVAPARWVVAGYDPVTGLERYRVPGCDGSWVTELPTGVPSAEIIDCGPELRAIDGATGGTRWSIPDPTADHASPGDFFSAIGAVGPTTVALAAGDELLALDLATGRERWREQVGEVDDVAIAEDVVLVSSGGDLLALEATSGEQRWRRAGDSGDLRLWAGDDLVVARDGHRVEVLDAADGAERDARRLSLDLHGTDVAAVSDDVVLLGNGETGRLVALDRSELTIAWTADQQSAWDTPVVVEGDVVAYASEDCDLTVADIETGDPRLLVPEGGCFGEFTLAGGRLHHVRWVGQDRRELVTSTPG